MLHIWMKMHGVEQCIQNLADESIICLGKMAWE